MNRTLVLGLVCVASAAAQNPSLASLQQAAEQAESDWMAIAGDVNVRVARFLPCDPRTAAAIEEVRDASTARLATLAEYQGAAIQQAVREAQIVRDLLDKYEAQRTESAVERTDTAQEQTAVATMLANLSASAAGNALFDAPRGKLQEIEDLVGMRTEDAAGQAEAAEALVNALTALVTAFEDRRAALEDEAVALEAERARWNAYYEARLSRARLECTITGGQ